LRYLFLLLLPFFILAKPFKVATYNVENLFDASFQGSEYEEYIPGKHNWNRRMVEIKLNHTAEVICDLDADILGLQEIENRYIFKQLVDRLKRVGCGYKYSAITNKAGAPIQVALLSRYPIKRQKDIVVSYAPRVRNILEVEIEVKGKIITLFVNHWKSKSYKGYESKRIKYAKVLQKRISRLHANREYILLGDFNADYNAYLTLEEKINDANGINAFNDILKTKLGNKLVDEIMILNAKKGVHYSLWNELPIEQRWSHKFYGKKSSLDHIVLPQNMFNGKGIDYVNDSFGVFRREYLFTKRGYINRWRFKNGKHMAKGYSDHLPIFAYFDAKPYRKNGKEYISKGIKTEPIEYLYTVEHLNGEIKLEDVAVVLKRGNSAVLKQRPKGRGVYFFGGARGLKEGHRYDLLVDAIKSYKGLKEVVSAYKLKDKGSVETKKFMKKFTANLPQNEVVKDIVGIYKNRYLYIGDSKIPIYFKKRKLTPKNGTRIKLHYAHIGYYKREQLVVYSKKDFTVLE
jgi:hypothetical protein